MNKLNIVLVDLDEPSYYKLLIVEVEEGNLVVRNPLESDFYKTKRDLLLGINRQECALITIQDGCGELYGPEEASELKIAEDLYKWSDDDEDPAQ